jgi:hypothetical protein
LTILNTFPRNTKIFWALGSVIVGSKYHASSIFDKSRYTSGIIAIKTLKIKRQKSHKKFCNFAKERCILAETKQLYLFSENISLCEKQTM